MERSHIHKNLLYGFMTWLVPFTASIAFFDSDGQLHISFDLFKALILLISVVTGCIFVYLYFKSIERQFLRHGIALGAAWMAINIALDVIVLPRMMNDSFENYFNSFGLLYLLFPAMTVAVGALLQLKVPRALTSA